ncbi:protein-L-isoaspartate O-methyltransferase [Candidatus Acetothermia bacterium]|nr:MAG: protein-L-isoaspartate O-methyltransferase [Candidatus Acetothermia bacterium]
MTDRARRDEFCERRVRMVEHHLRRRGIRDERVLEAFLRVRREEFVPPEWRGAAYADHPLPIGEGQTISQPYIVALMTEALALSGGEKVLEIGTGSGYQTAILAELGARVWTIERSAALSEAAAERLNRLGYSGIRFVIGDGTLGLPDEAPFDRIIATGSFPSVPERLTAQLREGGIFVGPIGGLYDQDLIRIAYHPPRHVRDDLGPCRFVPLIGEMGWKLER